MAFQDQFRNKVVKNGTNGSADYRGDDWFTPMHIVAKIMTSLDLRKDVVYFPCDQPCSNFVKWAQEHPGFCKEWFNTWNDYKENRALFDRCTIVITNPPYSCLSEFMEFLQGKEFALLLSSRTRCKLVWEQAKSRITMKKQPFTSPDGKCKLEITTTLFTSREVNTRPPRVKRKLYLARKSELRKFPGGYFVPDARCVVVDAEQGERYLIPVGAMALKTQWNTEDYRFVKYYAPPHAIREYSRG